MTTGVGLALLATSVVFRSTSDGSSGAPPDYAFERGPADADSFRAANPARAMHSEYAGGILRLAPENGSEPALGLELIAVGRGDRTCPPGASRVRLEGNRAEVDRPGLREWYLNLPAGLEQGFTLFEAPAEASGAREPVELVLRVHGDFLTVIGDSARDARFVALGGDVHYSYAGLRAWDATGRELPARLEAAADRLSLLVEDSGARYPVTIDPLCAVEQAKLTSFDADGDDHVGIAVAIDGNTALVGGDIDALGAAYVYVRSGTTWSFQTKLTGSDSDSVDRFGHSLALSGNTAVVGANGDMVSRGSIYVFVRSGTTWSQQAKLTASDAAQGDALAERLSISGDTLVAGAVGDDDGGSGSGSAYVFVRSGTTWSQQAKLTASDAAAGDEFGSGVAIDGDTIVVGALLDDISGVSNRGSSYVFTRSGTTWSQQAKLLASDGLSGDGFGSDVAVSGDRALIGAPFDDTPESNAGSAYVFVRNGTTWTQEAKLVPSDQAASDNFGERVSLTRQGTCYRAVCSAEGDDPGGSAYVFLSSGGAWSQQAKLVASDVAAGDAGGRSVSVSGATALVGASNDDGSAPDIGSAYAWDLSDTVQPVIFNCADYTTCTPPGGGVVDYPVFVIDNCDPSPLVVFDPPSGSFLTSGTHNVTCTATDCDGNSTTCEFEVCVDGSPPTLINLPDDPVFTCTSTAGSFVLYTPLPSATDDCDPNPTVECEPPSGSFLPPGTTTVTCTATDSCGNESTSTFTVTLIPDTTPPDVTCFPPAPNIECGPGGGVNVFFFANATDDCDGPLPANCSPGPGFYAHSLTPYTITCSATDIHLNTGQCTFQFTVQDTTPPTVFPPGNMVVQCGMPVGFAAAAADICDPDPQITYMPNPGAIAGGADFPLGVTTVVNCRATDHVGLVDNDTFTVTVVDNQLPAIACADVEVECTSPNGQSVSWPEPAVTDACDDGLTAECTPPSGSSFPPPPAETTVTCTATDLSGNVGMCTFAVRVVDTTPPMIQCPATIEELCKGTEGTPVSFMATATDVCDEDVEITYAPPSGSAFPVGITAVTCTATDDSGNEATCTFDVVIFDKMPPEIECPADVTAECTSADGTAVSFIVTATDDCDAEPEIMCEPPSGSPFPHGTTTVTCTATDEDGNVASCSFDVTIIDTTPPLIVCNNRTVQCTGPGGTPVSYTPQVSDDCDPSPVVECTPPSGSIFFLGTTEVTCTATDADGNSSTCEFLVTVVDTLPPTITCPANMLFSSNVPIPVSFSASASDVCDSSLVVTCVPPSGSTFNLGSTTVVCTATDDSGNQSSCSFVITTVPFDEVPTLDLAELATLVAGALVACAVLLSRRRS